MKKTLILLAAGAMLAFEACPQAIQEEYKVKALGDKEAADSLDLYNILSDNAPGDFPTAGVPLLTVVGQDGKFVFGAGGFVKAVAGWDIGHPMTNPDEFITSQIPVGPVHGEGSRFSISGRQTHLYLNFVLLPGQANQIGAFIGANLLNDDYSPALQYAYLKYRGLKVGYDNSLFSDPACGAPSVDYEGPCSNTTNPIGAISYTWEKGAWELGGGVEMPHTSFTTVEGKTKAVYQRVPDIPLAAKYSWDDGNSWVRASAVLRNMTYRAILEGHNHNTFGYGLQLSGAENFLDRFTFYWQGVWGKGIGSMIQDTVDEGLDLTPDNDGRGLKPVMLWGGFMALRCNICKQVVASVTYSMMRTYAPRFEGGETEWGDLYKYAQYICANVFYEATSFLEVGLEYDWGRRTNYDRLRGTDNRLQASVQLTF